MIHVSASHKQYFTEFTIWNFSYFKGEIYVSGVYICKQLQILIKFYEQQYDQYKQISF